MSPWVGYQMGPPQPPTFLAPKPWPEKSSFEIAAKWLEIYENVNRARLTRHFLALHLCLEQAYSFRQSPK